MSASGGGSSSMHRTASMADALRAGGKLAESMEEVKHFPGTGGQKMKFLHTSSRSFGMRRVHPIRMALLRLVLDDWFEVISLLMILANTVILSLYAPTEPQTSPRNSVINSSSVVFSVIFTLEMLLKMVALGPYGGKHTYFGDRWNWLDAAVVVLSWIGTMPDVQNLSSLRLLRLLRTLNTRSSFRVVLHAILASIPALAPVLLLGLLFIMAFALVRLVAGGLLHRTSRARCS